MDEKQLMKIVREDYPLPNKIIIDVNWDCNLGCKMCVKRGIEKPSGQRPVSDFIALVEKLPWIKEVSLGALGDAFSYQDLDEAMMYLKAKKLLAPLTSNGTQITDDNITILGPHTPLYISIDGGTRERYKSIRGQDCLDLIKQNIIKLRQRGQYVAINHLLFKDNIQEAKKLIEFCALVGTPITFFYPIHFYEDVEKECNAWRLTDLQMDLIDLELYAKLYNVQVMIPSGKPVQRQCFRAFSQPIVAYDGTVYPCDYIYQQMNDWTKPTWNQWHLGKCVKVPQYQYAMGNLYTGDFIEMWKSNKWKQLRSLLTELNSNPNKYASYEDAVKDTDLTVPFDYCKSCPVRWSMCL